MPRRPNRPMGVAQGASQSKSDGPGWCIFTSESRGAGSPRRPGPCSEPSAALQGVAKPLCGIVSKLSAPGAGFGGGQRWGHKVKPVGTPHLMNAARGPCPSA